MTLAARTSQANDDDSRMERLSGKQRLALSRPMLVGRLNKLVGAGVLKKVAYQQSPARYDYRLTPKGLDLHPVIMAIVHWGDIRMAGKAVRPLLHRHTGCGHLFDPVTVCSGCLAALSAREVTAKAGPGARDTGRKRH